MSSVLTSFNYGLELTLIVGRNSYVIPANGVQSITLNFDYDRVNAPSLVMKVRLDSRLYNIMVLNAEDAVIVLRLFKVNADSASSIRVPYIEDRFKYKMSTDPNYNETFERLVSSNAVDTSNNANSYLEGYIGLVSIRCNEDNKKLFNDILKNTNLISIIHKYTSHMNMCIEPFDNSDKIDQFIIPPITSITELIKYINERHCLYKNGYRFFRDFNVTYLLSEDGTAVEESSNKYNTIIISITDPLINIDTINSIELDRTNHAYIINVNANNTSIKVGKWTAMQYNSIIGVDTLGNIIEEDLDIPGYPDSTRKPVIERVPDGNLDLIYNTKRNIESASIIVTVSKTEIDSTILTPNKEYQIKNYSNNREYDGRYVLSFKKEVLLKKDETYVGNVVFGLRKVREE